MNRRSNVSSVADQVRRTTYTKSFVVLSDQPDYVGGSSRALLERADSDRWRG